MSTIDRLLETYYGAGKVPALEDLDLPFLERHVRGWGKGKSDAVRATLGRAPPSVVRMTVSEVERQLVLEYRQRHAVDLAFNEGVEAAAALLDEEYADHVRSILRRV